MSVKLTKRGIQDLPTTGKRYKIFDSEIPSLFVRVSESGSKAFYLRYRDDVTRKETITSLGGCDILHPEDARVIARDMIVKVKMGRDPVAERKEARGAPTITDLAEMYMKRHASTKKPASAAEDRRQWEKYIVPRWGKKACRDINREDVRAFHSDITAQGFATRANRLVALLSKAFNLAEDWGMRPENSNPCRLVKRNKEKHRDRILTRDELIRLGDALDLEETEKPIGKTDGWQIVPLVRLLLFTGCRVSEIMHCRWDWVDAEHHRLRLPDSKGGAIDVELAEPAWAVIESLPRKGRWLFPCGTKAKGKPMSEPKGGWARLCAKAGLEDVHMHDLRHVFGSVSAKEGAPQRYIAALLHHKQMSTTERYVQAFDDERRKWSETTAGAVADLLGGSGKGKKRKLAVVK